MKQDTHHYQGSVLIVDDTPETLKVLTEILKEEGYEVRPAPGGKLALQAAINHPPDLILLDIMMPEPDGYEVCKVLKARQETKEIPIIFVTALNYEENEEKGFEMGAVDYITKPIKPALVKARVKTHIQLKKHRDELKNRKEELEIANKELETFSYSVSHDLRAPLHIVKTFSELIKEELIKEGNENGLEDIQSVLAACNRMYQLIEDLLELSKIKQSEMRFVKTDLAAMAVGLMDEITMINSNRGVKFTCDADMEADVDPKLFKIVLYNLISNAWKYTAVQSEALIHLGKTMINGDPTFYIQDNGIGFDMGDADSIFCAFKRLHHDQEYEGTGIGLATVSRIIEKHRGEIWVESKVGEGTTFYFTVPELTE